MSVCMYVSQWVAMCVSLSVCVCQVSVVTSSFVLSSVVPFERITSPFWKLTISALIEEVLIATVTRGKIARIPMYFVF